MIRSDDASSLALLFHMNSEPWLNLEAYATSSVGGAYRPFPCGESLRLSELKPVSELQRAIVERRSCRSFADKPLEASVASSLLGFAYGTTRSVMLADGQTATLRPVPSAGGLYPMELYFIAYRVNGLSGGVYRYHSLHHAVERIAPTPDTDGLSEALMAQYFIEHANLVIFMVASFDRTLRKYGPRGYRYMLLEAGHIGQVICLVATEFGLSTLCIGGFHDHKLGRLFGLREKEEGVLYSVAVGHPEGNTDAAGRQASDCAT
jgi:SagB-type dehydrogenase family enzyme